MSTFSEKLRILRKNKEWTQAQLADALSVSESTVQKWEVDKNAPPVSEIKRLAEVFYLPVTSLVDDAVDIPEFIYLESIPAEDFYPRNAAMDSTPHKVYDGNLCTLPKRFDQFASISINADGLLFNLPRAKGFIEIKAGIGCLCIFL